MRLSFRSRLLLILALFAVIPTAILTAVYSWTQAATLRELSSTAPFERVAETGLDALEVASRNAVTAADSVAIEAHRAALRQSLTLSSRLDVIANGVSGVAALLALGAFVLVGIATFRVAGHLSRQLSRPLQELVGWTELIARGEKLPEPTGETGGTRGAPEFETLRQRMRLAARELGRSRERAIEAERLRAFRESARQVAHELKNLLTPIRFAVSRLQRDASQAQPETVEVLDHETRRLEDIARNFAQFGKLPEGPEADVDIAELVSYTTRTTLPDSVPHEIEIGEKLPSLKGHHDALSRALANVLLNAAEATKNGGGVRVAVRRSDDNPSWILIQVADQGHGMDASHVATIWDPYVTYKQGGTGLGLAITKQTIEAHGGRVHAKSTLNEGTVITFHLPTPEVRGEAVRSPRQSPAVV